MSFVSIGPTPSVNVDLRAALGLPALEALVAQKVDQATFAAHTSNISNPHGVNAQQVNTYTTQQTDTAINALSTALNASLASHANNTNNPHAVTKAQIGLSAVDNTSDAGKPVSTAQAAAIAAVSAAVPSKVSQLQNDLGFISTVTIGTTAGTVAAGNDSRIVGAAQKGANSDITSLSGLTTPLSQAQGGTGATALGDAAFKATGTTPGTVAAGDDSRIVGAVQVGDAVSQASSGRFYTDNTPPARINRLADRLFVGAAVAHDGKSPSTSTNLDWLETLRPYTTSIAQASFGSTIGLIALACYSRSSDSPLANAQGCIGIEAIVNNDNATQVQYAFGAYHEARRQAGAGTTHTQENDIANLGSVVDLFPGDFTRAQVTGLTTSMWLASGAGGAAELGTTPNTASAAAVVLNNGAQFRKGIVVAANAIDGMTGVSGDTAIGTAVALARGHQVNWYDYANNRLGYIYTDGVANGGSTGLRLGPTGARFGNEGYYPVFDIINNLSGVNYPSIANATTGNPVALTANGTDTNIGIALTPKGTGATSLGSATAPVNVLGTLSLAGLTDYAGSAPTAGNTATVAKLYRGQQFNWYNAAGTSLISYVRADSTNTANPTGLKFDGSGAFFGNGGEYPVFRVTNTANAVNYPVVSGGVAGSAVNFRAAGTDANIGINILPVGNQGILFGGSQIYSKARAFLTAGDSYTITAGTSWLACLQAGTIASATFTFPVPAGDGHQIRISTIGAITAVTLSPQAGGAVVLGAPAGLSAHSSILYGWDASSGTAGQWVRLQ